MTIAAFAPQLHVITSKQRPRKLTIHGGDGADYMFLLKVFCLNGVFDAQYHPQPYSTNFRCSSRDRCLTRDALSSKSPPQGHEDLRQDERVMQLFGLVNTLLANDRITAERDLSIARYAVIPLSPNR